MLTGAWAYKTELENISSDILCDPNYKWLQCGYSEIFTIENSDWNLVQRVSVHGPKLLGFLQAKVARCDNTVTQVTIFSNYLKRLEHFKIFEKDLLLYMADLLGTFRKVCWSVAVGNPVERSYDKFIKLVGGRVVGTKLKELRIKGDYYDEKLYEVLDTRAAKNAVLALLERRKNGHK